MDTIVTPTVDVVDASNMDAGAQQIIRRRAVEAKAHIAHNQVMLWFQEHPDANPHHYDVAAQLVSNRRGE